MNLTDDLGARRAVRNDFVAATLGLIAGIAVQLLPAATPTGWLAGSMAIAPAWLPFWFAMSLVQPKAAFAPFPLVNAATFRGVWRIVRIAHSFGIVWATAAIAVVIPWEAVMIALYVADLARAGG